jgi:hypothetical protein
MGANEGGKPTASQQTNRQTKTQPLVKINRSGKTISEKQRFIFLRFGKHFRYQIIYECAFGLNDAHTHTHTHIHTHTHTLILFYRK